MTATGDCFIVAAKLVTLGRPRLTLCHGKALGRGGDAKGLRYWHAWAEDETHAIDKSNGLDVRMVTSFYYALGSVSPKKIRRYTRTEAMAMLEHYEHYGPWPEGNS
jgi:hypothetical protein